MATYSQDWSAGFDAVSMENSGGAITDPPGASTIYPNVIAWDNVTLDGSGRLVYYDNPSLPEGSVDWQIPQWAEEPWPSGIDGTHGKFTVEIDAVAQAFDDATIFPFVVFQKFQPTPIHRRPNRAAISMYLWRVSGDTWAAAVGYYQTANNSPEIQVDTYHFNETEIQDAHLSLTLCWDLANPNSRIRLFLNGTLIYDLTGLTVVLAGTGDEICGFELGNGFPGPVVSLTLDNLGCDAEPEPPGGGEPEECCSDTSAPGGGRTGPDGTVTTIGPRTNDTIGPFVYTPTLCGGMLASATDPTDPQELT